MSETGRNTRPQLRSLGQRVFGEDPLHVVDVGALWGLQPQLEAIADSVDALAFDPDPAECDRLNRAATEAGVRQRFVPVAVAGGEAERPFHVTRKESSSSLLEPNRDYFADFADPERVEVEHTVTLHTRGLGSILADESFELEFLKLDAHGVEPEILDSVDSASWANTLGVYAEVLFAPMHGTEPTFAAIDSFLQRRSFQLYSLRRYVGRRAPFDVWRYQTNGRLAFGDALYLRDPTSLAEPLRPRLAAVAACFGHYDLALELFRSAGDDASASLVRRLAARRGPLTRRFASRLIRLGARGRALYGLPAGHWTGDDESTGV